MNSIYKWVLGFITLWIILLISLPPIVKSLEQRISTNQQLEDRIKENQILRNNLEGKKSQAAYLLSLLYRHKAIDDSEFYKMKMSIWEETKND